MGFVASRELAENAREHGYAVPAFNSNGGTYDITRAAIEAAEELRSPMILQTYEPNCAYRGFDYFVLQAAHLAKEASIPVAVHLDHGMTLDSVIRAVKAGYTSVMIDASHLPMEENVRATREVIEAVRPMGVTVEAEVGHVAGGAHSHGRGATTDPDEAARFVEATGVDMLAVANGTEHGVFQLQDQVDLELIRELRQKISVPLVQHGTCGIPLSLTSEMVKAGMAKFNYGEPFRANYIGYFREFADTLDHKDHAWKIMQAVKDRLKEDMKEIIRALGSEGKA